MALERFNNPSIRPFSLNIKSLPGAKFYFYNAGTSTPRVVYQDKFGLVPHTNPVVADASGFFAPIFIDGLYRVVLTDKDDVVQSSYPIDNIGNDFQTFPFGPWAETYSYSVIDIVYFDNKWFKSLQNGNLGNNPSTATEWWSQILFLSFWNEDETYTSDDQVVYAGKIWLSDVNGNTGNVPGPGSASWSDPSGGFANPMTTEGDVIVGASGGNAARLAAGAEDDVLTIVSGVPAWAPSAGGGSGGGGLGVTPFSVNFGEVAVSGSETITLDCTDETSWYASLETANTTGIFTVAITNIPDTDTIDSKWVAYLEVRRMGRKTASPSITVPVGYTLKWAGNTTPDFSGTSGDVMGIRFDCELGSTFINAAPVARGVTND